MSDHNPTADDNQQDDTVSDEQREQNDAAADSPEQREHNGQDQHATEQLRDEQGEQAGDESARPSSTATDDGEQASDAGTEVSESSDRTDTERNHQRSQTAERDEGQNDDMTSSLAKLEDRLDQTLERIDNLETQLEDYERRNDREHEELKKFAVEDLAGEMLKVKDSLMDAIEMEELEAGTEQRLRIVGKQFDKVLTSGRIDRIEPKEGDPYNDDRYRMVAKEPTDKYEPNHVVRVQEIGYRIHDRVIRPARVVVAEAESQ